MRRTLAALLLLGCLWTALGCSSSGQTGSLGPVECYERSECLDRVDWDVAQLTSPLPEPGELVAARCVDRNLILASGQISGLACECELSDGDVLGVGPPGAGCQRYSRGGTCLWTDAELDGECAFGDHAACDAPCAELLERHRADRARSFDVDVQLISCGDDNNCHDVLEIDGACYADRSYLRGLDYDCALGPEGVLEAHREAQREQADPGELIPEDTPYLEDTDGVITLGYSHSFHGTHGSEGGLGVMAQFYSVDGGDSARFGDVIDPLEGVDDCGVVRESGLGVGGSPDFVDVEDAALIDGAREIPLEPSPANNPELDFYTYFADLTGVEPRFGGDYGLRARGGGFGADVEIADAIHLPQALSITTLEQSARVSRGPLTLRWTGRGEAPLRVRFWIYPQASLEGTAYEIECLMEDDGEHTIDADVMEAAPEGFVRAYFDRASRAVREDDGKRIHAIGRVDVSHTFALGEPCDGSEVMAACERYHQALAAEYAACDNEHLPPLEETCPDYLSQTCLSCPEHFECRIQRTVCEAGGLTTYSGSCPCL